ncbi:zinc-binding dehydrogenase, partial [Streptomyces viridiviolaceus]
MDVVIDPVGGELSRRAYELLAPFGRLVVLGNASGHEHPVSTDSAWLGSRQVLGLSLGGVAHLVPDRVAAALSAVIGLTHRDILREPVPGRPWPQRRRLTLQRRSWKIQDRDDEPRSRPDHPRPDDSRHPPGRPGHRCG